jgi:hypothetical protein
MGNGKSNKAERKELSGPGTSLNGNHIIAANSFLKPSTGNSRQFALYFTDLLGIATFSRAHTVHRSESIRASCHLGPSITKENTSTNELKMARIPIGIGDDAIQTSA